ncbi:MAG: CYTH domain-containing protein [Chlorobi bacterium]|nr:CYTH domain-containing protein [Chlorobiota bacterium]
MNNREIERKFLVLNNDFINEATEKAEIKQGYLSKDPERTIRIRIKDDKGFLTVKGITNTSGTERFEYETEINKQDALQLLDLCLPEIIIKTRYFIPKGNHTFEVDIFEGKNKDLITAEVELNNENEFFEKPNWLGQELTGDKRFYNSYLSDYPFSVWDKKVKSGDIISEISKKMISYFEKDVRRINHALKVYAYAQTIGKLENISPEKQEIIEICGLLHDIGIKVCEEKYDSTAGKYQEIESPIIAEGIISKFNIPQKVKKRILFIISNHHTYSKIDDTDFQILVEADFLVNFEEGNESKKIIPSVKQNIFKTETGLSFLNSIF